MISFLALNVLISFIAAPFLGCLLGYSSRAGDEVGSIVISDRDKRLKNGRAVIDAAIAAGEFINKEWSPATAEASPPTSAANDAEYKQCRAVESAVGIGVANDNQLLKPLDYLPCALPMAS